MKRLLNKLPNETKLQKLTFRKYSVHNSHLDDKSNIFTYPINKLEIKENYPNYTKSNVLFSGQKSNSLTMMKLAGTGQAIFCFSVSTLFHTIPEELFQYSNPFLYANISFGIGFLSVIAVFYYSRHFILEIGKLDDQNIRLVTGNYFGVREEIIPISSLESDSIADLYSSTRKDYFIFKIKGKSTFGYLCDISAKDAFMDRKKIQELFSNSKRSLTVKKEFPYK